MPDIDIDYNSLGQAIDTTWGRSSTPVVPSHSVKFNLHGNLLIATYAVMVNFGTEKEMILTKRECAAEAGHIIKETLSNVKKTYSDLSEKRLTAKQLSENESLEIVGFGIHNPKRTACYRKKVIFEIG